MEGGQKRLEAGYPALVIVWAALLGLTWVTVALSGARLGTFAILAPFVIASVKAFLVADYFMRLRSEGALLKWLLLVVMGTVVVLGLLIWADVAYRG